MKKVKREGIGGSNRRVLIRMEVKRKMEIREKRKSDEELVEVKRHFPDEVINKNIGVLIDESISSGRRF